MEKGVRGGDCIEDSRSVGLRKYVFGRFGGYIFEGHALGVTGGCW